MAAIGQVLAHYAKIETKTKSTGTGPQNFAARVAVRDWADPWIGRLCARRCARVGPADSLIDFSDDRREIIARSKNLECARLADDVFERHLVDRGQHSRNCRDLRNLEKQLKEIPILLVRRSQIVDHDRRPVIHQELHQIRLAVLEADDVLGDDRVAFVLKDRADQSQYVLIRVQNGDDRRALRTLRIRCVGRCHLAVVRCRRRRPRTRSARFAPLPVLGFDAFRRFNFLVNRKR